jgi:hypothetical protein
VKVSLVSFTHASPHPSLQGLRQPVPHREASECILRFAFHLHCTLQLWHTAPPNVVFCCCLTSFLFQNRPSPADEWRRCSFWRRALERAELCRTQSASRRSE